MRAAIQASGPLPDAVRAHAERMDGGWSVRWRAPDAPAGARALVALTHSGLSQVVPRGENAGRTLQHDHVVRAFEHAPVTQGSLRLEAASATRAVVLVSRPDRRIIGAALVPLP